MRPRALLERYAVEALALALALAGQIELWVGSGNDPRATAVIAALVATLPLLLRRRLPFGAPAFAFTGLALISLFSPAAVPGGTSFTLFALMLAFWAAGAQHDRQQAAAGAAIGLAAVVVMVASGGRGSIVETGDVELSLFIWSLIAVGLPLGAFALRARAQRAAELQERADRLEREREERTRAAVAAERARIARALHDVIAHSVTVMTVQGGAARLLLDSDPARAREPLLVVEETGHQALADMRRLVGIVQDEPERAPALTPQPGLADLPALAEKLRRAGLPTDLVVHGKPETLTPGVELAAYRVVQEALTNALKHAGPARARVTVSYEPCALRLEISDDGPGTSSQQHGGHGLVGMRERVALYGGHLEVSPRAGGGFSVRARLPLERLASARRDPSTDPCRPGPAGEMIDHKTLPSGSGR
jgi:signal transduction histidine kinase